MGKAADIDRQRLAHQLRKARIAAGITQKVAAAEFGVSENTVYRNESHVKGTWPPADRVRRAAILYQVSADYLLSTRTTAHRDLLTLRAVDTVAADTRAKQRTHPLTNEHKGHDGDQEA